MSSGADETDAVATSEEQPSSNRAQPFPEAFKTFIAQGWEPYPAEKPEPLPAAAWTAGRRQALSELFPGERLVVGAGGLGSPVLAYLAAAGVGTIGVADADVVDPSNLQRQVLHGVHDVGRRKVDSAADRLAEVNPPGSFAHRHLFHTGVPLRKRDISPHLQGQARPSSRLFHLRKRHRSPQSFAIFFIRRAQGQALFPWPGASQTKPSGSIVLLPRQRRAGKETSCLGV